MDQLTDNLRRLVIAPLSHKNAGALAGTSTHMRSLVDEVHGGRHKGAATYTFGGGGLHADLFASLPRRLKSRTDEDVKRLRRFFRGATAAYVRGTLGTRVIEWTASRPTFYKDVLEVLRCLDKAARRRSRTRTKNLMQHERLMEGQLHEDEQPAVNARIMDAVVAYVDVQLKEKKM